MKIVRKLTADGDYFFGYNKDNFITGISSIAQMIRTKLLLFKGEWWEDILDGLPLFQEILNEYNIDTASRAASRLCGNRILEVDGVKEIKILDFSVDREQRKVTIHFTVDTIFGELEEAVEI